MIRTAATLLAVLVSPVLAQSEGATATIHLTHDDDDGVIEIGDTVTWTLAIAYAGVDQAAVSASNMTILANDNALGTTSNFDYNYFIGRTGYNGGTNGGASNGAGIEFICFTNSIFLESFGGASARRDNPLLVGAFDFIAENTGTLDYVFTRGLAPSAFLSLDLSAFSTINFQNPEDVTIVTDTLTIVPTPATIAPIALTGLITLRRRR